MTSDLGLLKSLSEFKVLSVFHDWNRVIPMITITKTDSISACSRSPKIIYNMQQRTSNINIGSLITSKLIVKKFLGFAVLSSFGPSFFNRSRASCSLSPL